MVDIWGNGNPQHTKFQVIFNKAKSLTGREHNIFIEHSNCLMSEFLKKYDTNKINNITELEKEIEILRTKLIYEVEHLKGICTAF